jgi:ElaB/YqjD/DUF883 family membrane-anchored ribosome-binding protein
MTELQKMLAEYENAHSMWFATSIYAPKEIKDEVDKRLKKARARYEEAYQRKFPNHEILHF